MLTFEVDRNLSETLKEMAENQEKRFSIESKQNTNGLFEQFRYTDRSIFFSPAEVSPIEVEILACPMRS